MRRKSNGSSRDRVYPPLPLSRIQWCVGLSLLAASPPLQPRRGQAAPSPAGGFPQFSKVHFDLSTVIPRFPVFGPAVSVPPVPFWARPAGTLQSAPNGLFILAPRRVSFVLSARTPAVDKHQPVTLSRLLLPRRVPQSSPDFFLS